MFACLVPGQAMSEKPRLQLGEALDLVRAIEIRCQELRREEGAEAEQQVAELETVVSEIRKELNLIIVTASQTRDR